MTSPGPATTAAVTATTGDLESRGNGSEVGDPTTTALSWAAAEGAAGVGPGVVLCVGVLVLSPLILVGNALLLNALYRFKRLRTPSNYLLASLASSDLGVGVLLPLCAYLELSAAPAAPATPAAPAAPGVESLCALPQCLLTSLCCASLLVMAAIAVDRFTSLSQPLRYNNLITHRSVERYIAALWLYAVLVGSTPLAVRLWGGGAGAGPPCSGAALLRPPAVAAFLLLSVYAPCAVLVVGCYSYVYLVARNHHRAIYSVEISLRHACRHGHDVPYASRYTATLAITVGLFVCLWLPFQVAMVVDLVRGSRPHLAFLSSSSPSALCLALPLFASSALNPWVYGYRNGEVRAAVQRLLHEMLTKLGLSSPHFGCPHLMTTGADAELNSFASNVRLCTVSAVQPTGNTHQTVVPPCGSPLRSRSVSVCVSEVEVDLDAVSATPTPSLSPSELPNGTPTTPGERSDSGAGTPPVSGRAVRAPSHPTLLVPAGHTPPSRTLPTSTGTVISLAQTVIELRVPVPEGPFKKRHHV